MKNLPLNVYTTMYGGIDISAVFDTENNLIANDLKPEHAKLIVKAVNHHQELVNALESLLESADKNDVVPNGFYEYKELLNKIKGE